MKIGSHLNILNDLIIREYENIISMSVKFVDKNIIACAVTKTPKHHHITPVLKSLHWLKVPQRIHYKIVSLTYNTLQTSRPSYIRQWLTIQPPGSTHSSLFLYLSLQSHPLWSSATAPCCTSSLEWTPKRSPSVCSYS